NAASEIADAAAGDANDAGAGTADADAAPAAGATEAPTTQPSATATESASAAPPPAKPTVEPAFVFVHNRPVFEIRVPRGGSPPKARAAAAAEIVERILSEPDPLPRAIVVPLATPDEFALRLGDRDVFGFGPDDVAASGTNREAYTESLRVKVDTFLS